MTKPILRKLRAAVYTRKSSEEGLEQEFNSLDAQCESCEAYVASQKSEGWALVRDRYDDGGYSGGTLERPGLKRLLADIEDGLVDVVVVYKIDRLSRSLADFAKLVEVFDRHGVTFVSVTQSFNTTSSMGRLTLNILLSFAQFEREVTAERIRDKFAASRKKGMWMGGVPPYGYRVESRKLVLDDERAEDVRWIYARFLEIGSCTELAREVGTRGIRTPHGNRIDKKYLYRMLNNRAYIGEAVHKGDSYPGEHQAIIDREMWDKVHAILQESPRKRAARTRAETPALLKGLLFGPGGVAFSPTHTVIGLPPNLFYSTGIPVCILVLKKCKKPDDVLFINASEHFERGKRQNYLSDGHIAKIIDTYQQRPDGIERYAKRVEMDEIEANDFNLNISRYVSTAEEEAAIDLSATHEELVEIEQKIRESTAKHNAFLKELGLSPLPGPD